MTIVGLTQLLTAGLIQNVEAAGVMGLNTGASTQAGGQSYAQLPVDGTQADELDFEENNFEAQSGGLADLPQAPPGGRWADGTPVQKRDPSYSLMAVLGVLILVADGIFFLIYRKNRNNQDAEYEYEENPQYSTGSGLMSMQPGPPVSPLQPTPPAYMTPPLISPVQQSPGQSQRVASVSGLAIKQTWGDIRGQQAERIAHGNKSLEDDQNPPDMFELANQHPESFGSQNLYDKEANGRPVSGKKPKAA